MRLLAPFRFSLLVALVGTIACSDSGSPTVIDGSSKAAFAETLAAAKGDLGPKDRVKFEVALGEFRSRMFAKADDRQEFDLLVRRGLDGLTAPAIVAKFDENTKKLGNDAADAIFDAKKVVTKGYTAVSRQGYSRS